MSRCSEEGEQSLEDLGVAISPDPKSFQPCKEAERKKSTVLGVVNKASLGNNALMLLKLRR